jgi:hypothetical protein
MARIEHVKRARKSPGSCGKCSVDIQPGEPYYSIAFRYGGKRVRCAKPECRFRRSDTTQSKMSTVYAAQETAEELLAKWDGKDPEALATIVSDAAEAVREVAGEYQAVGDEHPNLASANEERVSELESLADELEGFEVEDFDKSAETREEWAERMREEAEAVLGQMSEL